MKTVDTFTATIYVGLKEGYNGSEHLIEDVELLCQEYCDEVGLGVTIIPLRFVYTKGNENGCAIELINYPRFPSDKETIKEHAIAIADMLLEELGQLRLSIVCSDRTYLIEK
jgi:hypothetical protein